MALMKETVQALSCDELEMFLSFISHRDITEKARAGLRYMQKHGHNISSAALMNDINRDNLSKANKKVMFMFRSIQKQYNI